MYVVPVSPAAFLDVILVTSRPDPCNVMCHLLFGITTLSLQSASLVEIKTSPACVVNAVPWKHYFSETFAVGIH